MSSDTPRAGGSVSSLHPLSWEELLAAGPREDYSREAFAGLSSAESTAKHARQLAEHARRERFVVEHAFAIPSPASIAAIERFVGGRKLLEVGAGTGLWARLLHEAGVQVTATDAYAWQTSGPQAAKYEIAVARYFPVVRLSAVDALERYRDHEALLIGWPPYATSMAEDAARAFGGDRLVYIGEPERGVTADRAFFALLREGWRLGATIAIPRWPGVHDAVFLYERRPDSGENGT